MQKKQYNIELSEDAEEDFDLTYVYYTSISEKLLQFFIQAEILKYGINAQGFE